ncbi:MAG: DUF2752 domain-containing protein [Acidimicrobiia bacterium]
MSSSDRSTRHPLVSFRWERYDRHPTITRLALIGIPLTLLLAVLGLPPIDIHGPLHYLGVMGPTCGLTRGVMWTVRGDLGRAWQFNPASLLVVLTLIGLTIRAAFGRTTGRWLTLHIRQRLWLWLISALLAVLLALRQQNNIDLLLANPAG